LEKLFGRVRPEVIHVKGFRLSASGREDEVRAVGRPVSILLLAGDVSGNAVVFGAIGMDEPDAFPSRPVGLVGDPRVMVGEQ
jgi:hypothetical protein